jgi:hypothetical protein
VLIDRLSSLLIDGLNLHSVICAAIGAKDDVSEAVMNQETKYLQMLQAAERFEWKDPYLLIYCRDFEKPLRFTRMSNKSAPATHDR